MTLAAARCRQASCESPRSPPHGGARGRQDSSSEARVSAAPPALSGGQAAAAPAGQRRGRRLSDSESRRLPAGDRESPRRSPRRVASESETTQPRRLGESTWSLPLPSLSSRGQAEAARLAARARPRAGRESRRAAARRAVGASWSPTRRPGRPTARRRRVADAESATSKRRPKRRCTHNSCAHTPGQAAAPGPLLRRVLFPPGGVHLSALLRGRPSAACVFRAAAAPLFRGEAV